LTAEEDCNLHSHFKGKIANMNEEAKQTKGFSEDTDTVNDDTEVDEVKKCDGQKTGLNEYEQNWQRNIENLKQRLRSLKENYPIIPKDLDSRKQAKMFALYKKKVLDEPVIR
jgi:hypothetical protein